MKNIKNIAVVAGIIASLGISTAFAATDDNTSVGRMRSKVCSADQTCIAGEKSTDYRNMRRPRAHKNNPFKTLAELTNKDEKTIMEECRAKKLNPAQYADKNGVFSKYKATRLTILQERLAQGVKNGKITQAKADEFLKGFNQRMEDARNGKMPMHRLNKHKMRANGPQGECLLRRNADGSVAQGSEGMAYREHPMYGKMPLDTLANITGKAVENLYAEAYKEKLNCAGLAKKLGVLDQYKAERLTIRKEMLAKAVSDGKLTQAQADKALENLGKRIEAGQHEGHMGHQQARPRFSPMHPGPVVPHNNTTK